MGRVFTISCLLSSRLLFSNQSNYVKILAQFIKSQQTKSKTKVKMSSVKVRITLSNPRRD